MIGPKSLKTAGVAAVVLFLGVMLPVDSGGELRAQGVRPPSARPPARPSTPGPKVPAGVQRPVSPPKTTTTKDLEEARIRRKELRDREREREESTSPPADAAPLRSSLVFETPLPGDVKVLSTRWTIAARRGAKPFTSLQVKVFNRTDSLISIRSVWINGPAAEPLIDADARPLPEFPIELKRFPDAGGLPTPIKPHSTGVIELACPFALKPATKLRAEVGDHVKFRLKTEVEWDALDVLDWATSPVTSAGEEHTGLFIRIANDSPYDAEARLKVGLSNLVSAGGMTFFYTSVRVPPGARKSLALRSIPDEGVPPGDPDRETHPPDFDIRSIEVVDVQF